MVPASLRMVGEHRWTHRLWAAAYSGQRGRVVIFCSCCGYYAERTAKMLAKPCEVRGREGAWHRRTGRGEANLKLLRAGRHPALRTALSDPWPLPEP